MGRYLQKTYKVLAETAYVIFFNIIYTRPADRTLSAR